MPVLRALKFWSDSLGIRFLNFLLISLRATLVSNDVESYCATFFYVKSLPTKTPTQKFKNRFSIFSSHEIGSSLVSFEMIFEAVQF